MAVQGLKNNTKNDKLNTIWDNATQKLKNLLNEETFTQWITPVLPVSYDEKNFVLGVSDEIFLSWLQDNFGDMIATAVSKAAKKKLAIKFEVGHFLPEQKEEQKKKETAAKTNVSRKKSPKNCHNRHTFKNFVVGLRSEVRSIFLSALYKLLKVLKNSSCN